ncbi:HNH endonuclease signature motif containing protein [Tistrella mobilis]|uniref:HNH endonuclease n=1 Tax=Tistrella mobilis TaxID=171437 RepID=UPI0035568148
MTLSFAARTILEKAAVDNGFSLDQGVSGDWLIFKAHAAPASLCLTVTEDGYGIGTDHEGVARELDAELASHPNAPHGFHAWATRESRMLSSLAGTVWRLARSLPDEPLRQFKRRLAELPPATEVERLRKERIGQDVFREALMLFWDGACAVTGVSHPRLLRASHIVPWSECDSDAERLNVHNGLLLAAHLDAAFDAHLISFNGDGQIMLSSKLSESDSVALGLAREMHLRRVDPETEQRLVIHRMKTLQEHDR